MKTEMVRVSDSFCRLLQVLVGLVKSAAIDVGRSEKKMKWEATFWSHLFVKLRNVGVSEQSNCPLACR